MTVPTPQPVDYPIDGSRAILNSGMLLYFSVFFRLSFRLSSLLVCPSSFQISPLHPLHRLDSLLDLLLGPSVLIHAYP